MGVHQLRVLEEAVLERFWRYRVSEEDIQGIEEEEWDPFQEPVEVPKPSHDASVSEWRKWIKWFVKSSRTKRSTVCPCCTRKLTTWKQSIHSREALELCVLVRHWEKTKEPLHYEKFKVARDADTSRQVGPFYQMRHWGLVIPGENTDPSKKGSGYWIPTEKGIAFVKGEISLTKFCITFKNRPVAWFGDKITIHEALNRHFDFQAFMRGEE